MSEHSHLGKIFELEIAKAWKNVPSAWRTRLRDGGNVERPADELVLLPDVNLLNELKRTNKPKFTLSMLRSNQINGLLNFEKAADRNYGLIFFNYFNEENSRNRLFVFRLVHLLFYIQKTCYTKNTFALELFENTDILNIEIEFRNGYYDLLPLVKVRDML